jgi:predicted CXXCH cytochrome family protein
MKRGIEARMWLLHAIAILLLTLAGAPGIAMSAETAYAGSRPCITCHAAEVKDVRHSHHGWALREPSPENVLGDFSGVTVEHKGEASRFFRDGERFMVETDGPDGRLARYPVAYTVGVAPLQQYLVETGAGRLQALDFVWDVAGKRWLHLYPDTDVSAGNAFHWTGTYKNWQTRCAECHQTGFEKGYDPKARAYSSRWAELTVSCESCHGPAKDHLAWARNPSSVKGPHKGFAFALGAGQQAAEIAVCGPCHARREPLGDKSPVAGSPFDDHYNLALLRPGLFFPDGQQNDEVFVLGSFLQSKMAQKGVTCSNCHTPHTATLVAEGDAVCTQCHGPAGNAAFPSLRLARYDSPEHHRHPQESAGARCVSCHMPERAYMRIDPRRDHFFRMPDPGGSAAVGSPDACTQCHTDKSQQWAAEQVAAWFPDGRHTSGRTTAKLFADLARSPGEPVTVDAALALAADPAQPAIRRASALDALGEALPPDKTAAVATLLTDKEAVVRAAATRLLRGLPPAERAKLLAPLLADPVASVRIAAAMNMAGVQPGLLSPVDAKAFEAAARELQISLTARADFPETQMVIAGLAMTMRNWPVARAALAEAGKLDPQLSEAWLMQARIAAALGEGAAAEQALKDGLSRDPQNLTLKTELAGFLVNAGRAADAVPLLVDLVAASPGDLDLRALLALAQLMQGDVAGARASVAAIRERDPLRPLPPALEQLR